MTVDQMTSFESVEQLDAWFQAHHSSEKELWVRIFKKASEVPSVSHRDCIEVSLTWGWIDGLGRSFDKDSYLVRLTPRRQRSTWSKRNTLFVEKLLSDGRMKPTGLAQVEEAKADGRWDRAYAGSGEMEIPPDFIVRLQERPIAQQHFANLSRRGQFLLYLGLQTARTPETRERRIERYLSKLEDGRDLT